MSQQNTTIRLVQPATGMHDRYQINEPNMRLALEFFPENSTVEHINNNLVFSFENGAQITLENYYDHLADKTLPTMVMNNGEEVQGEAFLASLGEDFLTAAGPTATAASSGLNNYSDTTGTLIDGVSRLDMASGDKAEDDWRTFASEDIFAMSTSGLLNTESPTREDPFFPPDPVDPIDPVPPFNYKDYTARSVLFMTGDEAEPTVGFYLQGADSKIITPAQLAGITITSENGLFNPTSLMINPDGSLSLSLSAKGKQLLADALAEADNDYSKIQNLFDYIIVTRPDGSQYSMQVVINSDGSYSPQVAEQELSSEGKLQGEWHSEINGSGRGVKETGDGNDVIWIKHDEYAMQGSTIKTGKGIDQVNITGSLLASANQDNIINTGQDKDISGADHITLAGKIFSEAGGSNTIITHDLTIGLANGAGANNILAANESGAGLASNKINASGETTISYTGDEAVVTLGAITTGINGAAENIIIGQGNITLAAHTTGDQNTAILLSNGTNASNRIESASDIKAETTSNQGAAYGLYAANKGSNYLQADGEVRVSATSGYKGSRALYAKEEQSENYIKAHNIYVESDSEAKWSIGSHALAGGTNRLDAENILDIKSTGRETASGIYTQTGGRNLVNADTINIHAEGNTWGLGISAKDSVARNGGKYTKENADNLLQADGNITVHATATDYARAIQADTSLSSTPGSHNWIETNGKLTVTAENAQTNIGAFARRSSYNTLVANDIEITAQGGQTNSALRALAGGENVLQTAHEGGIKVELIAKGGTAGSNYAMYAYGFEDGASYEKGYSRNSILGNSDEAKGTSDRILITGDIATGFSGQNLIKTGSGADYISIKGDLKHTNADGSAYNRIDTGNGNDSIEITGNLIAEDGRNQIFTGAGNDLVIINGNLTATERWGENAISTGEGNDLVKIQGMLLSEMTSHIPLTTKNTITSHNIEIGLQNNAGEVGVYALNKKSSGNATNIIKATGNIDVNYTGEDDVRAFKAETTSKGGKAENTVEAKGNVDIKAISTSEDKEALAVSAEGKNAVNTIKADGEIQITATSEELYGCATAVDASNQGKNVLEAKGQIILTANGESFTRAVEASGANAQNLITSFQQGITLESNSENDWNIGLFAVDKGGNTVKADNGLFKVDANGGEIAIGVRAETDGRNIISAKSVEINARDGSYETSAVTAVHPRTEKQPFDKQHADNFIYGKEGISITASGGSYVRGVIADAPYAHSTEDKLGGHNWLETEGKLTVEAENASTAAMAVGATSGCSQNTLVSNDILLMADGTQAYGLYAYNGSANLLKAAQPGGISVEIIATTGSGQNAFAMFAKGFLDGALFEEDEGFARNIIQGNSDGTQGTTDLISLTGDIVTQMGGRNIIKTGSGDDIVLIEGNMTSEGGGRNLIDTGEGADHVYIKGAVTIPSGLGETIVKTGAGDDVIHLHGKIGVGALTIRAGEGHDTLVLQADSLESFEEFYQEWLTHLHTNGKIAAMGIEKVIVHGSAELQGNFTWLSDIFGSELVVYQDSIVTPYSLSPENQHSVEPLFHREDSELDTLLASNNEHIANHAKELAQPVHNSGQEHVQIIGHTLSETESSEEMFLLIQTQIG